MKTLIKVTSAALLLFAISCTKTPMTAPNLATAASDGNANAAVTTHFIGEHFAGGIIFYTSSNGSHGLIADTSDLPATNWYNGNFTITGVTATNIGSGKANTRAIILTQGTTGKYAAIECAKSKRNGFTDWYLPSRDELNALYLQKAVVGVFSYGYYWTSSEIHDSSIFSWGEYFYSGAEFGSSKDAIGFVRAIRSF